MQNPDTPAFERAQEVMASGQMVGDYRPVARMTVGKNTIQSHRGVPNIGMVRDALFAQPTRATEREFLGIVKSIEIRRSIDDDAAQCTIQLYNEGSNLNSEPLGHDTLGRPGYWGPNRRERNLAPEPSVYQHIVHMVAHAPGDLEYDTPEEILERISDMRRNRSLAPDDEQDLIWQQQILDEETTLAHVRTELDAQAAELLGYDRWLVDWDYTSPEAYNNPSNSETGDPTAYPTAYLNELLIPNRILRTYQGYGSQNVDELGEQLMPADDGYVLPWEDEYLFQTGVWLIDRVTINTDGFIQVECSDLAKLLVKQFIWPPMIPTNRFPLTYCPVVPASGSRGGVGKNVAGGYHSSSNDPWYGRGASVYGHRPAHAFDGNPNSYWLSVGNVGPTRDFSFEWIQTPCGGNEVNEIVLNTRGSYTVYVSVMENGTWQGSNTVPYNRNAAAAFPNGADIKYVLRTTIGSSGERVIKLPRTYKAQYVRVCFANLWNSGLGVYPYRAALREFRCRWNRPDTYKPSNKGKPGVITSWTDAVKELLAWSGFTWHVDSNTYPEAPPDPLLGRDRSTNAPLRVWGDFEETPGPKECSAPDQFLNKSFMEAVNTIAEWLGCVFFVDESGGAIFRLPNIYAGGNFLHDPSATEERFYLDREWPVEFHDDANLVDYSLVFDDSELRSEILVVGGTPSLTSETIADAPILGGVLLQSGVPGLGGATTTEIDFSKVLAGQYRLMVPPSENTKGFTEEEEAQRMAELTALFILFTYRRGEVTAPAHPGLQIDDQVRVFNRMANEFHVQYVSSVNTTMDLDEGVYTMTCSLHWLGGDPDTDWFFNRYQVTPAMRNYPALMKRLGTARDAQREAQG